MEFAEEGKGFLPCVLYCPMESLTGLGNGPEVEDRYQRPLVGSQSLSNNLAARIVGDTYCKHSGVHAEQGAFQKRVFRLREHVKCIRIMVKCVRLGKIKC